MDQPVYLVSVQKLKEAYYQWPEKERRAYIRENVELLSQASGEVVIDLKSAFPDIWKVAVMKYPNIDSAIQSRIIWTRRNDRYVETTTYIGYQQDEWTAIGKALGLEP